MGSLGKRQLAGFRKAIPPYSIGIGPFLGYVADKKVREKGRLDNCSFNDIAVGPCIQAEMNPFVFYRNFSLGVYVDIFRTFFIKTYDDHYFNSNSSAGDIGAIKIGILLSMKKDTE